MVADLSFTSLFCIIAPCILGQRKGVSTVNFLTSNSAMFRPVPVLMSMNDTLY